MVTAASFLRCLGRSACGLALALLYTGPVAAQAVFFDVERSGEFTTPIVRIAKPGVNETLDLVPAERLRLLREAKQRLEAQSGLKATLMFTDMGKQYPNAFTTSGGGNHVIAINLAMFRLMGEDPDAMAAVLGHEYAHIALNHRESRKQREVVRQGAAILIGALLGAARVPMGGTLGDLGTSAISTGFSRDEERDADEKGLAFASAAGYSPEGGIRAWERMAAQGRSATIPFLATHPGSEERAATMRTLAAKYPPAPPPVPAEAPVAAAARDPDPAAAISLKELQELESRGLGNRNDARVWQAIAGHYAAFGDVDAARRVYGHVVRLEPANLDALEKLGALHAKAGEAYRVEEVWQALLQADAKRAEAYFSTYILP